MDKEGYDLLLELADEFIAKKEVGQIEIAEGMMAIFGNNYTTSTEPEGSAFSAYFSAIQTDKEAFRSGDNPDRPAPPPFSNGDSMVSILCSHPPRVCNDVIQRQKTRKGNQLTGNSEFAVANFGVHLGATIVVERSGLRLSLATAAANFTCHHRVERSGLGLSTETTAAKFTCHHSGGEKWAQTLTCDHRGGKKETKTLAFDHGGGGVWTQLVNSRFRPWEWKGMGTKCL
ncbi:hypothetical protein B0H14DRAFT_3130629 [Mycena olivaceomarginata]|nr:hypothetical protein B0H14DRAFT_3130629 [Mycena olivaceomarginata]